MSTDGVSLSLSQQDLAKFDQNGFLVIPGFFDPQTEGQVLKDEAKRLLEGFDPATHPRTRFSTGIHADHVGDDYFLTSGDKIRYFLEEAAVDLTHSEAPINKIGHGLHLLSPPFRDFTLSGRMSSLIKQLGFKQPRILQSMLILKQSRIGGAVPPHQDSTFLYTQPLSTLGFWFALEPATPENGCLWFAPGSHHRVPIHKRFVRATPPHSGTTFMTLEPISPDLLPREEKDYLCVPAQAGDLVLIHGSVMHKSEANRSNHSRWAYTFHCIEELAEYDERNWLQTDA